MPSPRSKKYSQKNEKRIMISKVHVYIFFKNLFRCKKFLEKVKALREELGIKIFDEKEYENEENREKEFEKYFLEKSKVPKIYTEKIFRELCAYFFIPESFWQQIDEFIQWGRISSCFSGNIQTIIQLGGTPTTGTIDSSEFLIPHTVVYIPFDPRRKNFDNIWPQIHEKQKEINWYLMKDVHFWKNTDVFHTALRAYKYSQNGLSKKQILENLEKEGTINRVELYLDKNYVYEWVKDITPQIESLRNWDKIKDL